MHSFVDEADEECPDGVVSGISVTYQLRPRLTFRGVSRKTGEFLIIEHGPLDGGHNGRLDGGILAAVNNLQSKKLDVNFETEILMYPFGSHDRMETLVQLSVLPSDRVWDKHGHWVVLRSGSIRG